MATKNQVRAALRKKQRRGLLPPQRCLNPRCDADLTDPTVPEQYEKYRLLFSLALERRVDETHGMWECPVCGHRWGRHQMPRETR